MKLKRIATVLLTLGLAFGGVPALAASAAEWDPDGGVEAVITTATPYTDHIFTEPLPDAYVEAGTTFVNCTFNQWVQAYKDNLTFKNCTFKVSLDIQGKNITVDGGTMSGHGSGESQWIRLTGAVGTTVKDLTIENQLQLKNTKDCKISNIKVTGSEYAYPINIDNDNGSTIDGFVISKNGTNSDSAADVLRFVDSIGTQLTNGSFYTTELGNCSKATLSGCTMHDLVVKDSDNCVLKNDKIIGSTAAIPLLIRNDENSVFDGFTISKNGTDSNSAEDIISAADSVGTQILNSKAYVVFFEACTSGTVKGNALKVLTVKKTTSCTIADNSIIDSPESRPLQVEEDNGSKITGNTLKGVGSGENGDSDGLILEKCKDTSAIGNTVSDIKGKPSYNGNGIIAAMCTGTITIKDNTFSNINNHGIEVINPIEGSVINVENNKVNGAGYCGVALRNLASEGSPAYTVNLNNNKIENVRLGMDLQGAGLTVKASGNRILNTSNAGLGIGGANVTFDSGEIMNAKIPSVAIGLNEAKTSAGTLSMTGTKVWQETVNDVSHQQDGMAFFLDQNTRLNLDSCVVQNYCYYLLMGGPTTTVTAKDNIFITAAEIFDNQHPVYLSGAHDSLPDNIVRDVRYYGTSVTGRGYNIVKGGAVIDGKKIPGTVSGEEFKAEYPETDATKVGAYVEDAYGNTFAVHTSSIDGMAPVDTTQIRAFVARLYTIILGREAEEAGLEDWTNRLATRAASASQVAGGIIFSDEFTSKNYCNEHFLQTLYLGLFDRTYDEGGYNDWLNRMEKEGLSRERVVNGFFMGTEFANLCEAYGMSVGEPWADIEFGTLPKGPCSHAGCGKQAPAVEWITHLYGTALHRAPDEKGLNDWINDVCSHRLTGKDSIYFFFFSDEYRQKFPDTPENRAQFVTDLYNAIFDRDPDEGGFADWMDRMETKGYSREDVINGFVGSEEFGNTCRRIGIKVGL
ncbi:MAG: DUF4214 domain-containing protein [Lachnospiraceae bacterium]|nr:DUF4214 domain-containing protein [Lachnospiraceae bacterium]